jgi:hypothetical protein
MLGWKDVLVQFEQNKQMLVAAEHERLVLSALCCKGGRGFLNMVLSPFMLLAASL